MFSMTTKLRGLGRLQPLLRIEMKHFLSNSTPEEVPRHASSHAFQQFDIMSIGSGGSAAQRFRGLPSTMFNLGGENWIFDVGEGTLRQLSQKFGQSVMDTTRIFISKFDNVFPYYYFICYMWSATSGCTIFLSIICYLLSVIS